VEELSVEITDGCKQCNIDPCDPSILFVTTDGCDGLGAVSGSSKTVQEPDGETASTLMMANENLNALSGKIRSLFFCIRTN
jgi:hypothetical protein